MLSRPLCSLSSIVAVVGSVSSRVAVPLVTSPQRLPLVLLSFSPSLSCRYCRRPLRRDLSSWRLATSVRHDEVRRVIARLSSVCTRSETRFLSRRIAKFWSHDLTRRYVTWSPRDLIRSRDLFVEVLRDGGLTEGKFNAAGDRGRR